MHLKWNDGLSFIHSSRFKWPFTWLAFISYVLHLYGIDKMNKNYYFLVGVLAMFVEHYASITEVLVSSPDSAWIVSSFLYRTTNGSNIWNFINPLQCILRLTVTRLFCLILHEGMALTDHEMVDIHYSKMASLQVIWRHLCATLHVY